MYVANGYTSSYENDRNLNHTYNIIGHARVQLKTHSVVILSILPSGLSNSLTMIPY